MLRKLMRIMNLTEDEIINHPSLLVNVFDQQHRILFWNKKCEEFFGIKEEDALDKIIEDLIPHARHNKKMDRLEAALSGKEVFITEDTYENKGYHYTQVVFPLKNYKGEVIAAVNIVRFITYSGADIKNEISSTGLVTVAG